MLPYKIRVIFKTLGTMLILLSLLMFLPFLIGLFEGEDPHILASYILTAFLSGAVGYLFKVMDLKELKIDISTGMLICVLGWLLASLVVAFPFTIGFRINFLDAYFEAMSGFTTTGITLLEGLEGKPTSLLFLRSFIQWLGGLGILSFFIMITARSEGVIWNLFRAEAHKITSSRPVPNLFRTIKILWCIYAGLSILQLIFLVLAGLSFFDAITHTMTTISTGGFSRFDASIAHFEQDGYANYRLIEYIFILFMFLGGTNFLIHYKVLKKEWRDILGNAEYLFYIKLVAGFTLFITAASAWGGDISGGIQNIEKIFRTSLFQVLAILTTTGYETQYIGSRYFIVAARQLFLVMMLIGGSTGSTAGGVKVLRVLVLKRLFDRQLKTLVVPRRAVMPLKIENSKVEWRDVFEISGLFFAWLLLILMGGLITALFSPHGIAESLSGMFSAVNNIGPSYITVSEMIAIHPIVKVTYIIGMLAGRLEIIPVIIILRLSVWRS